MILGIVLMLLILFLPEGVLGYVTARFKPDESVGSGETTHAGIEKP
jgi:hypothetical protein